MEGWKKKEIKLLGAKGREKSRVGRENEKLDGFGEENRRVFPPAEGREYRVAVCAAYNW